MAMWFFFPLLTHTKPIPPSHHHPIILPHNLHPNERSSPCIFLLSLRTQLIYPSTNLRFSSAWIFTSIGRIGHELLILKHLSRPCLWDILYERTNDYKQVVTVPKCASPRANDDSAGGITVFWEVGSVNPFTVLPVLVFLCHLSRGVFGRNRNGISVYVLKRNVRGREAEDRLGPTQNVWLALFGNLMFCKLLTDGGP